MIVDDDPGFAGDLALVLEQDFECTVVSSGAQALKVMREGAPELVLLDLMLGEGESGLDVLARLQQVDESLPVVMITEHASVDSAVEAMKRGAFSYVSKTTRTDELILLLNKARQQQRLQVQAEGLRDEVNRDYFRIVGESPAMNVLREKIALFARNPGTVLITGESGTGKELVARQVHHHSDLAGKPFVAVNCAAIPRDLVESELFGHEAGAFTGAGKRKPGKLELAGDGVIFFDEIGELDLDAQSKLLRVLEEREYQRVGGTGTLRTEARVLAATNRDLETSMQEGTFRDDLFYRLEMLTLHVPPLRDRRVDIPPLIEHFLVRACHEMKTPPKEVSPEAMELLMRYDWPGNVRELRNAVGSAAIMSPGSVIEVSHFNPRITRGAGGEPAEGSTPVPTSWEEMDRMRREAEEAAGRAVETRYLESLLEQFDGNVTRAASHAGINRSNLYRMMRRCGLA